MSLSRILSRFPRIVSDQCRNSFVISSRHHPLPVPSNRFHSLGASHYKLLVDYSLLFGLPISLFSVPFKLGTGMMKILDQIRYGKEKVGISGVVGGQGSLFHHSLPNAYAFRRFGFSSVPSPENPKKEKSLPGDGGSAVENSGATAKASGDAEAPQQREAPVSEAPNQDQSKQENNTAPLVTASSRWNPTPEQLQALEDMYEGGTRTPTADQIKLIAGELRRFGKIEGKNVFYWFKNHRARGRQKRRREHRGSVESEVPGS
ncbi:hypothetical protein RHMOL_Rhmol04G0019000 [Rhododendron molle]|uniref:Uncharacterized protein n=1 Tax=Rhododendron molle TaxID=49168 RepID=A0ACC0NWB7_RHOML|nr:hypothetical protein RHMOL_Rhmol04G0019000 [Rhododendron molle]